MVLVASAVVVLTTASTAFAAGLGGVFAGDVSGGNDTVVGCDSDGFATTYTTSAGSVTGVTVTGIADPGCEGGSVRVTLANSSSTDIGSGGPQTVPTDGDTSANAVTVSISPQPPTIQVARVHVSIAGP